MKEDSDARTYRIASSEPFTRARDTPLMGCIREVRTSGAILQAPAGGATDMQSAGFRLRRRVIA
jgi:hypothetical protein